MSLVWQVFEPPLFGLVGAEVSVEYMYSKVVGELLQWNNLQAGCWNFSMVVAHLQSGFFPSPPQGQLLIFVKTQLVHVVPARAITEFLSISFFFNISLHWLWKDPSRK